MCGDVDPGMLHADGIVRRVLVVLADEDDGQLPHRRDIERLVELALRDRAVAEEAHRHVALAVELGGERGAARDGQPTAHDAVGAQHADGEVGDVHRPALALAVAVDAAEQLGHHAPDVGALGDAVPVAPVVARHAVSRGQARAHAGGDGLLAHVGMHGPVDLAGHAQRDGPLVELADEDHRAEHLHRLWLVERHGRHLPRRDTAPMAASGQGELASTRAGRALRLQAARGPPSSTSGDPHQPRTCASASTAPRAVKILKDGARRRGRRAYRVRFHLQEPWPNFMSCLGALVSGGWIVPKKYVEQVGDDGFKTRDRITIDLAGYTISGSCEGVGAGVTDSGTALQGTTVKNGTIKGFADGVLLANSTSNQILNLTSSGKFRGRDQQYRDEQQLVGKRFELHPQRAGMPSQEQQLASMDSGIDPAEGHWVSRYPPTSDRPYGASAAFLISSTSGAAWGLLAVPRIRMSCVETSLP